MLSSAEYRSQIERQLRESIPDVERRRLLRDTITGFGQARYNDGHDDGVRDAQASAD